MAVTIVNIDNTTFSIDGVPYLKNFMSVVTVDLVRILNTYDSKLILKENTIFSDYTIDGGGFGSAILLQAALKDVLFNRDNLGTDLGFQVISNTSDFNALVTGATPGVWLFLSDVTLDGNKTLPSGVTLNLRDGKISGAFTLTGDDTKIEANLVQIFNTNVIIAGTWIVNEFFPDWFGAIGDDSTDNSVEIQKSIDFVGENGGGILKMSNGIFRIDTELTIINSNVIFKGSGRGSVIYNTNALVHSLSLIGQATFPDDLEGVRVTNLSFWGADSGSKAAIYMKRAHECQIDHNWLGILNKGMGYGVFMDGSTSNDVDNNIISNNSITRMVITGIRMVGDLACEENVISDNVISYAGLSGSGGNGIGCTGNRNSIVSNTIEESKDSGIFIDGSYNSVTGNTSSESEGHGIFTSIGESNIISSNICRDNDILGSGLFSGIFINSDNNIVSNNNCTRNVAHGISLGGSSNDNLITGNELTKNSVDDIIDTGTNNKIINNNYSVNDEKPNLISISRQVVPLTINGASGTGLSSSTIKWTLNDDIEIPNNAIGIILDVQVQDSGSETTDSFVKLKKFGSSDFPSAVRCYPKNDRFFEREVSVLFNSEEESGKSVTLTRLNSTVTATIVAHGYLTGDKIKIEGADQKRYNGNKVIIKLTNDTFTYPFENSIFSDQNTTPATGVILAHRFIKNISFQIQASGASTLDANVKIVGWILR